MVPGCRAFKFTPRQSRSNPISMPWNPNPANFWIFWIWGFLGSQNSELFSKILNYQGLEIQTTMWKRILYDVSFFWVPICVHHCPPEASSGRFLCPPSGGLLDFRLLDFPAWPPPGDGGGGEAETKFPPGSRPSPPLAPGTKYPVRGSLTPII